MLYQYLSLFCVSGEFPKVLKYQNLDKMIHHFLKPYFKNAPNFDMIAKAAKYHYLRGMMIPTFEFMEIPITKVGNFEVYIIFYFTF